MLTRGREKSVLPARDSCDTNIVNAGGKPVTIETGACFFDSAASFGVIRGGHVDITVLGAFDCDGIGGY